MKIAEEIRLKPEVEVFSPEQAKSGASLVEKRQVEPDRGHTALEIVSLRTQKLHNVTPVGVIDRENVYAYGSYSHWIALKGVIGPVTLAIIAPRHKGRNPVEFSTS